MPKFDPDSLDWEKDTAKFRADPKNEGKMIDLTLNGATVGTVSVNYPGGGTWLDAAAIGAVNGAGGFTITGIPANPTTVDRHAVISIPLTKAGCEPQTLTYTLTQKGIPTIDALWASSFVAQAADAQLIAVPTANPNTGYIDPITITGMPTWVTSVNVVGASNDQLEINFPANGDPVPLYGDIHFTMKKGGYAPQDCSIFVLQMPATTATLLENIVAPTLAYNSGSQGNITYDLTAAATTAGDVVVSVQVFANPPFSNAVKIAGNNVQVTSSALNATGANKTGAVVLTATSASLSTTEYYVTNVAQASLTADQLWSLVNFAAGGTYFNNVTKNGATAAAAGLSLNLVRSNANITGPAYVYINTTLSGTTIPQASWSGAFSEVNDIPDNFWNPGETSFGTNRGPSWDQGNTPRRMILSTRGRSTLNTGTSNFTLVITVDAVSVTVPVAITGV